MSEKPVVFPFGLEDGNTKPFEAQQRLMNTHIYPWVSSLTGNHILDLGSGQGIESKLLQQNGALVVSQDASRSMLKATYFNGDRVCADAGNLPYRDGVFDGVLLKDSLVFLNPDLRQEMFAECSRVLVPGGSMLVISEETPMRVWLQSAQNKLASRDIYYTNDKWKEIYEECQRQYDFSLYFETNPSDIAEVAATHGFDLRKKSKYGWNHKIAKENRWDCGRGTFVLDMRKG